MIDNIYNKYDKKKSCAKVKEWLKQYWNWKDEAQSKTLTIGSPSFDGLPKGTLYDPDYKIVDYVNAEREWKVRESVLEYIRSKGDYHEEYATILEYRFVKHNWKVEKVAQTIHVSKRTCEDMQQEALWEAARICPDKSVLVPK